jgi:hypothetical protein
LFSLRFLFFPFLVLTFPLFSCIFFFIQSHKIHTDEFNNNKNRQITKSIWFKNRIESIQELLKSYNYKNQSQTFKKYKNRRTTRFTCMPPPPPRARAPAATWPPCSRPRRLPPPAPERTLWCLEGGWIGSLQISETKAAD